MPREVHHHAVTMFFLVASLLTVLAVACWWEARSGKPAWGARPSAGGPTTRDASKEAKSGLAATLGTATMLGIDGGGDG